MTGTVRMHSTSWRNVIDETPVRRLLFTDPVRSDNVVFQIKTAKIRSLTKVFNSDGYLF